MELLVKGFSAYYKINFVAQGTEGCSGMNIGECHSWMLQEAVS